jgi:hypothetical protein
MDEVADPTGQAQTLRPGRAEGLPMTATPEDLAGWVAHVAVRLGVPEDAIDVGALLNLVRDVDDQVGRPAGALTTFLLGYALAAGDSDATRLRIVAQDLSRLAASWAAPDAP